MADEIAALQRKQQAEQMTREREAKERERKRLQLEMLRDKIERHQRTHGTVPHELLVRTLIGSVVCICLCICVACAAPV
jgi:hypothetical protein